MCTDISLAIKFKALVAYKLILTKMVRFVSEGMNNCGKKNKITGICIYTPPHHEVERGILESPWLSV